MKVTIRCERADGHFTIAQAEIPDKLPVTSGEQRALEAKILRGFIPAYRNCAELPE